MSTNRSFFPATGRRARREQPAFGQAAPTAPHGEIDAYIARRLARLHIPGAALGIVEGDQIVHLRGFGRVRPAEATPTPQTPFVLGSVTKSFTALATLQLVEAGKVALDAPVRHYLPWFRLADPAASGQITVRQLLHQTSGLSLLSGWRPLADFDDRPAAGERQARALATQALAHPPGAAFEYSNMNYNLLGLIIEAAGGEDYAAYIQDHIFAPLGMRHSHAARAEALQDGLAMGHRYWFGCPVAAPDLPLPRGSLPSGQLLSCAEDMAHYLIAHLNGGRYGAARLLSPEGIATLHRPAVDATMLGVPGQYGMGWFVREAGPTRLVWHTGLVPDFFTYVALLPEQRKGVVLLLNANHFLLVPALTDLGMGVAALLAGERPPPGQLSFMPLLSRALLLLPALQVAAVAATLRRLRRWQGEPTSRPRGGRLARELLLPILPDLLVAAPRLAMRASGITGFLSLFMPDLTRLARACGGFAGLWTLLRPVLITRTLRTRPARGDATRVLLPKGGSR